MQNDERNSLIESDPLLKPYGAILRRRVTHIHKTERRLTQGNMSLADFAAGHEYFGMHFRENEWIFREWAPNATAIYLIGTMTDWQQKETFALERINDAGDWEIRLPADALVHGDLYRLNFLLSNCRFWLDEYRFDGFRFDGVTSMLYRHHGLGKAFTSYEDYFDDSVDEDALCYLALANKVIHAVRPDAVTIAEDVSGMPGLAASIAAGGGGFDYRFAMGVPDYCIKLTKDTADEDWPVGQFWYELTNRRKEEKTISYAESHDQALVGDQTLIFRLAGFHMYDNMAIGNENLWIDRSMALHKLIRSITMTTAGNGYLNFMGNEFGHPEWIDFPREGNNWSYRYARRQWHLVDDPNLKYHLLARFDRDMIDLTKRFRLLETDGIQLLHEHNENKVLAFERGGLIFAFNFHPVQSYTNYLFQAPPGKYRMILDSDAVEYGGHGRLVPKQAHFTSERDRQHWISLYLPNRTVLVLEPV